MVWRQPGDKPLSEPMMVSLLTHICLTRPQWVNSLWHSDAIWRHRIWPTLLQVMYKYHPIFSNLGLCAACWAHLMGHHKLWLTSVSDPFSFLNSALGFAREKHYQKIAIPIFRLVLQNFALPVAFLAFFPSLSFLLTFFWLGCYCSMWLYFSSGK